MKKIAKIIAGYRNDLNIIEKSNLNKLTALNKSIKLSRDCLNQLRLHIRKNDFPSKEAEIIFFKFEKPFVHGRLKYFSHLHNYQLVKPTSSRKKQINSINGFLNEFEKHKKRNLTFFRYFKQNNKSLDSAYFLRGNEQLEILFNTFHYDREPEFSTSHDLKAAEVIAYDLLTSFYEQELKNLKVVDENKTIKEVKPKILTDLSWTGTKTELVELLYGLNAVGAIKNGQAEMKKLSEVCKVLFDIDLGNIYKTFNEIKTREKDPTKFLDLMKINLLKKLNSDQLKI